MRIEVRKSGEPFCPTCSSSELVCVIRDPEHGAIPLRRDFTDALRITAPWWRPFIRRYARRIEAKLDEVESELLGLTKYPLGEEIRG